MTTSLRVAFDGSILGRAQFLPVARSGIYRYADNLLQALAADQECDISLSCFGYSLDASGLDAYLNERRSLQHIPTRLNSSIRVIGKGLSRLLQAPGTRDGSRATRSGVLRRIHQLGDGCLASLQQSRPSMLARQLVGQQIFHTPFLHIPKAVRAVAGLHRFVTVHDLNPIVHPEHFPPVVRRWSNKIMGSIGSDDWVLTVSQYVKDDLCHRYGIASERVHVTYLAADPLQFRPCLDPHRLAAVRQRYGIPEGPYLLSLGSLSPHKNVAHLVRCFAHVLAQQGIRDLSLVLAGAEGWMLDELTEDMTSLNHAASRIVQPGFIDDADQAALYSGATAFVFPSLCEGFGLPPLEAMQCGTPVICANATSLPEVVGSAGLLINPLDADDLCQAILDVYRDEPLRQRLRLAGLARAKEFSWERCAHETFARYRQALN